MCCCASDRCTKRLVAIFGILTMICGMVAFGFSINMVIRTGWLREAHSEGYLYHVQVYTNVILFCTSFFVVLMGGLSFLANYCHRGACTFCYGFWLAIVIIVLVIVSLPVLTVYTTNDETLEQFCKGDYKPPMKLFEPLVAKGYNITTDYDARISSATDSVMCVNKRCPCKPLSEETMKLWSDDVQQNFKAKWSRYSFTGKYEKISDCMKEKKTLFSHLSQFVD